MFVFPIGGPEEQQAQNSIQNETKGAGTCRLKSSSIFSSHLTRTNLVARNVGQHGGRREIGHRNCGGRSVNTTPLDVEEPDVRQSCCVQWRNSLYGLRGVGVGEASNPRPPRVRLREVVSEDERLWALTLGRFNQSQGRCQHSGRPHEDVPGRNVRPRLRVRSVPPTIGDDEEDLEASAVSTCPPCSRASRRLWLDSGRAHDELTSHESMEPDAAIVVNIADPDLEVLLDTANDPDLIGERVDNAESGAEESEASSSGIDSIIGDREAHHAVGDVPVLDTVQDELIGDRATRQPGLCGSWSVLSSQEPP